MGNVMVIPARRQVGNTVKQSDQKKLRVAAYCRVSTDSEEQEKSYEAQVTLHRVHSKESGIHSAQHKNFRNAAQFPSARPAGFMCIQNIFKMGHPR